LTLQGLRRQIEPVGVDVLTRFLSRHHGLLPANRRAGANGLYEVIAMLQGIDLPAVCWERDLLPARVDKYRPEWLDELCLTGETSWGRLFPPRRDPDRSRPMVSLTRVAPLSIFLRSDINWLTAHSPASRTLRDLPTADQLAAGRGWTERSEGNPGASDFVLQPRPPAADQLSSPAVEVCELLSKRGAMFAADLIGETHMLPAQLDDVLGELVTRGLITADGFGGLRNLIAENTESTSRRARRRRAAITRVRKKKNRSGNGRWSLWRKESGASDGQSDHDSIEQWAWQLLRRWGVIFRDLLARESGAPKWFELLQVYRRLEARGEIRGGRFVAGVAGEQFAVGETVRQLRTLRDEGPQRELIVLTAADPLNLIGILTDHRRVPSLASNRVAYLDGVPVAALQAGEICMLGEVSEELRETITRRFGLADTLLPRHAAESESAGATHEPRQAAENTKGRKRKQPSYPGGIPRPMIS
jgi:ATP-dependent Lhr-like helicase